MSTQQTQARVISITPLTNTIVQLILEPTYYFAYEAGQYLQIHSHDDLLSYSIANAPLGSHRYELHIRHGQDNAHTERLLADIQKTGMVTLQAPFGDCVLSALSPHKPLLFVAGGTGFAPIKAMIEQLLVHNDTRPVHLFWGARSQSDLYLEEAVLHWQSHVPHFTYYPLVSEKSQDTLVTYLLTKHRQDLRDWQIVINGPLEMVYHTKDALLSHGATLKQLYSDAFRRE